MSAVIELAKIEKRPIIDVIKKERKKILERHWTSESSEKMVFLSVEQQLQENPNKDSNVANYVACLEESKRIKTTSKNLFETFKTTNNRQTLILAEKMLTMSNSLRFRGEYLSSKAVSQASQKSSSIAPK